MVSPSIPTRASVPGDRVTVDLSETVVGYEGEDVPLNILYEDDCCLAVDKPRGCLSIRRRGGTPAHWPMPCSATISAPDRPAVSTR